MNRRTLTKYLLTLPFLGSLNLRAKEELTKSPNLHKWLAREISKNKNIWHHELSRVDKKISDKMIRMERPIRGYIFEQGIFQLKEDKKMYHFEAHFISEDRLNKFIRVGSLSRDI